MLLQYWPTTNGARPTLKEHRVKSSSLQRELWAFGYTRAVCVWLEQARQSSCVLLILYDQRHMDMDLLLHINIKRRVYNIYEDITS